MNAVATEREGITSVRHFNTALPDFRPESDLPKGFIDFLLPLHHKLTPRQQAFIAKRAEVLEASHAGRKPDYLVSELFDEELDRILSELPAGTNESEVEKYCESRRISELLITNGEFDPI